MSVAELSLEDQVRQQRAFMGLPWSYRDPYRDLEDCTPEAYAAEERGRQWAREKARYVRV